ncbi:hypothetical protein ACLOJK_031056 [Asimina triloba]
MGSKLTTNVAVAIFSDVSFFFFFFFSENRKANTRDGFCGGSYTVVLGRFSVLLYRTGIDFEIDCKRIVHFGANETAEAAIQETELLNADYGGKLEASDKIVMLMAE